MKRRVTVSQLATIAASMKAHRLALAPLFAELAAVEGSAPGSVAHFDAINTCRRADGMATMDYADFQQRNALPAVVRL